MALASFELSYFVNSTFEIFIYENCSTVIERHINRVNSIYLFSARERAEFNKSCNLIGSWIHPCRIFTSRGRKKETRPIASLQAAPPRSVLDPPALVLTSLPFYGLPCRLRRWEGPVWVQSASTDVKLNLIPSIAVKLSDFS